MQKKNKIGKECEKETSGAFTCGLRQQVDQENLRSDSQCKREKPVHGLEKGQSHPLKEQQVPALAEGGYGDQEAGPEDGGPGLGDPRAVIHLGCYSKSVGQQGAW